MIEAGRRMGDQRSRLGAASFSIPLMVATFLLIAGFFGWLIQNAQTTSVMLNRVCVGVSVTVPPASGGGGVAVTEDQLKTTPAQFEGQVVSISLPVAMAVGTQAFFLDVTDAPFLVKLSDALLQQGQAVPQGQVTVTGPLMAMTDSIRQDWLSKGIIPQADEILVEFATHFIEARTIAAAAPSAPPAP
jgi:hypothetical protein